MGDIGKIPGQPNPNPGERQRVVDQNAQASGRFPTDPVADPSDLAQLKKALAEGANLNLLLLLVGKANIDQKQANLKKLQDKLEEIQKYIKDINTKNSQIQTWIQEHSKDSKWKKEYAPGVTSTVDWLMVNYGGYSQSEINKLAGKGQAQNMSNALTNTAKSLDQEAQRLTTKASQATQEFNSFVDIISSAMKSDLDAIKKTVSAWT